MQRADGDVAEEAEAHGAGLLGVVAGRAGGDEGVGGAAIEHGIDGSDHPAHAPERGVPRAGAGVVSGSKRDEPCLRHRGLDGIHIGLRMGEQKVGLSAKGRLFADEAEKSGCAKCGGHCLQPRDLFGVAGGHHVVRARQGFRSAGSPWPAQSGASM
jgi:hypothetical protein